MKELSIEEKAIAYDKALKQIKELTPDENGFVTIYPNEIFPELAEPEDERVRKELLLDIPKVFPHDKAFRYIAYLEKQGEQKPAWSEEDEKILKAIHNSVDVECLSKNGLDYIVMVDWFKSLKNRVQPKQDWSEEDRDLIEEIISHYRHLIAIGSLDSEHYKSYIIPKLKSILSQDH